ncbi:MAG: hypothetical protein NTY19_23695, partial [Planctomycetota bacterium]|nr:hypothetical protein [Planctomycetota bacterium]
TGRTDALGGTETWAYDGRGNTIAYTDARGYSTAYAYDSRNRLVQRTNPQGGVLEYQYDLFGNQTAFTDELGNITQTTYDALNRVTAVRDPLGGETTLAFNAVGNVVRSTDAIGRNTRYDYDLFQQLVAVTDPVASVTRFTYDLVGNQTSVTDPLGNVTQFFYDNLDRVTQRVDPLGQAATFTYDAVSNLVATTDRNGRQRTFTYDPLDRLTAETWLDGTTSVRNLQYAYDAVGNLLSASDPDSVYAYGYDALDRPISVDNGGTPGAPQMVLSYAYDRMGNVISTSDDRGVRVNSQYDPRNLLASRTWQSGGLSEARVDFGYSVRGQQTEIQQFADIAGTTAVGQTTLAYDALGRLTDLTHRNAVDAVLADYDYAFDLADQLVRQVINGQTSDYTYDRVGQLIGAEHPTQADEAYTYDANGNRVGAGYTVGPNNQILADDTYDYRYDAEGNRVRQAERATGAVTEYTYDFRNRLTSVVERNVTGVVIKDVQFVYDVFDRRIVKTVDIDGVGSQPAETTRFVYDGLHVWADFDQAGQVTARYLYGDGLDQILARYQPGVGTAWYLADHLGTVRDIVDTAGVVIDHIDYDSFGQIVLETNPAQGDRFKITGREWDVETGLYYYRARYFDPRQGRFVSADPLGFAAGDVNLYRYVGNAPVILRDPLGLEPIGYSVILQQDMAVGGAAVGAVMGYVCSYLEEWCQSGDATRATASGNLGMLQGAALGASLGYAAGSASALSKLVATSAGGAFGGLYLGTIPADLSVAGIRVGCLVAGILVGVAQRPGGLRASLRPGGLRSLGRGIWEFLGDERGSVPIGEGSSPHTPVRIEGNRVYALVESTAGTGPRRWVRMNPSTTSQNATRLGVVRSNTSDWRSLRNVWDNSGAGDILSPANRQRIADGIVPEVDSHWIRWFPGDSGLIGEPIPMHHIQGTSISVPLPASRHLDAHMPGGYRYNPGGPGMSG